MRAVFGFVIIVLAHCMSTYGSEEKLVLVEQGQPKATIVVYMKKDNMQEFFAAKELQSYIHCMTGTQIPISMGGSWPESGTVIFIGRYPPKYDIWAKFLKNQQLSTAGSFFIETQGQHIFIGGADDNATWYGIYDFLYHLGCRFYFPLPDGEYIPQTKTLTTAPLHIASRPTMQFRELWYDGYVMMSMLAKPENWQLFFQWHYKVGLGGPNLMIGHNMQNLVPKGSFELHPEYFPEIKGKRVYEPQLGQLCLSNRDVQKCAAETAINYLQGRKDACSFSIGMEDCGGRWCQCDKCRAIMNIRQSGESPTQIMQYFANQVAEQLDKSKIDDSKLLSYFAHYIDQIYPPANMTVNPRCQPVLVNILCPFHNVDEHEFNCPNDGVRSEWLKKWTTLSDKIMIYEWFQLDYIKEGVLSPMTGTIGERIKHYGKSGVMGFSGEICGTSMPTFLSMYLTARMMWHAEENPQQIKDEYFSLYFGPAASSMRSYYNLLEQTVKTAHFHKANSNSVPYAIPYAVWNQVTLEELKKYLDESQRIAENKKDPNLTMKVRRECESFRLLNDMWYINQSFARYKLTHDYAIKQDFLERARAFESFAASVEEPMVINRWYVLQQMDEMKVNLN